MRRSSGCARSSAPTRWCSSEIRRELAELQARPTATSAAPRSSPRPHDITIEDMIADEDMVITVTSSGYIKRSPLSLYRAQQPRRQGPHGHDDQGGRLRRAPLRRLGAQLRPGLHRARAGATGSRCTRSRRPGRRRAARRSSTCSTSRPTRRWRPRSRCASSPRTASWSSPPSSGTVKKTALAAYANPRARRHHRASTSSEGDRLLVVTRHRRHEATSSSPRARARRSASPRPTCAPMGRATDRRARHRAAQGRPGGRHGGARQARATSSPSPSSGYGKRTPIDEYREQGRGGSGIINLKVTAKTGEVVGVAQVAAGDQRHADHPGGDDHPHRRSTASARSAARPRASS